MNVYEGSQRKNITSTDTSIVAATAGGGLFLLGYFCASTSSGTLKIADSGGTIANTHSPVAGTFTRLPCQIQGTLTCTIAGSALDVTIFYGPT